MALLKKFVPVCLALVMSISLLTPAVAQAATAGSVPWIGFYVTGAPESVTPLQQVESQVGVHASVVNFFVSDSDGFPATRVQSIAAHGSIPLITLEMWSTQNGGVSAINGGSRDAALTSFADQAKAYGHEIWLRPLHEMNGTWYPWGGAAAGNTPQAVVSAWRHIHDIFAARGATNVKFVWCPNDDSVPNTTANSITAYWPGDAYTDMVAIDGYNFGTSQTDSSWRSFTSAFSNSYAKVTALTSKPLFVAETASSEQGGNKPAWITDMFRVIPSSFPRIQGIVWFDAFNQGDLRIDSSAASVAAFKAGAATWVAPTTSQRVQRVQRIAGPDRYATAVAISSQNFASADSVVIGTGLDFADALAAAPLAGTLHAPLLLVPGTSIPTAVGDEITRLGAKKAFIAGGPTAVSDGVLRTLQSRGMSVQRVMGASRFGTAAAIARKTLSQGGASTGGTVIITRGDSFADALGASSIAYNQHFPVLLVRTQTVPAETVQALTDLAPSHVIIVGGPIAISTGVENTLRGLCRNVTRVYGASRYETCAAVARYAIAQGWANPASVGLASGITFPDALGGGAAIGSHGGVLLLTDPAALSGPANTFLAQNQSSVSNVSIFGGTLRRTVETAVVNALP